MTIDHDGRTYDVDERELLAGLVAHLQVAALRRAARALIWGEADEDPLPVACRAVHFDEEAHDAREFDALARNPWR